MNNEAYQLREAVADLLTQIGQLTIRKLLFDPIKNQDIDWYLARLSHLVAPSYLPVAANALGILAIYLWPSQPIELSPFVFISNDGQQPKFVCNQLSSLPAALWLWVCPYFVGRLDVLRKAIDAMVSSIPNAKPIPIGLWDLVDADPKLAPSWWFADCKEHTEKAWRLADVGHPFVGLPNLHRWATPKEALGLLEPFIREHPEPELISLVLAAQLKAGIKLNTDDVQVVLAGEAWRESDCLVRGRWRVRGKGLCAWDSTLRYLPNPAEVLSGTPFEILTDRLSTYSGEDKKGPLTLASISEVFRSMGDPENTLHQLRNAMRLATVMYHKYPKDLALASAEICDVIEANSLAASVARQSVRIDRNAL